MQFINRVLTTLFLLVLAASCTTYLPVQMTPPLSAINADGINKKPVAIAYLLPSVSKRLSFNQTSSYHYGILSHTLKLSPYRDSSPVFRKVLKNVFKEIVPVRSVSAAFDSSANIKYLISISDFKTHTTDFKTAIGYVEHYGQSVNQFDISFMCKIIDRNNSVVWKQKIAGYGTATDDEIVKGGANALAPTRALLSAFQTLQKKLDALEL